jgi:MurNAc alpha-1-phosphate uridylyltransferase
MILAAGRGQRLAPLTDTLPKPLVEVGGSTLIERHIVRLAAAGMRDIVINVSYLGALIEARLGDGRAYGVNIAYSREPDGPLETGGGIARALPLIASDTFVVVNADIWTDFPFDFAFRPRGPAHLVLIANPPHHPQGDFNLNGDSVTRGAPHAYTYAGIGVFSAALFRDHGSAHFPLAPLLFELSAAGQLSGQIHHGQWFDIGTMERLEGARAALAAG